MEFDQFLPPQLDGADADRKFQRDEGSRFPSHAANYKQIYAYCPEAPVIARKSVIIRAMEFEVIKVGVIATVLIVGATSMIPIAVWLDYKFRDKLDRLLDRR
jgi:hypothetical protein